MKKFDKDKYLKNLKFKRNLTKYGKYFYIGVPCVLAVVAGIYFAYSKFSVFKEEEVVRTTVGEFIYGDVVIGAYIDGEYSNTSPGKNDGYVVKSVSCDNNATGSWDNDVWGIVLTNMTKDRFQRLIKFMVWQSKCYLHQIVQIYRKPTYIHDRQIV